MSLQFHFELKTSCDKLVLKKIGLKKCLKNVTLVKRLLLLPRFDTPNIKQKINKTRVITRLILTLYQQ